MGEVGWGGAGQLGGGCCVQVAAQGSFQKAQRGAESFLGKGAEWWNREGVPVQPGDGCSEGQRASHHSGPHEDPAFWLSCGSPVPTTPPGTRDGFSRF